MTGPSFLHASALVVGETGVLIEGPSGSGKSSLVEALLVDAGLHGLFAALVADDRVAVEANGDRLLARPHPAIAGLIERRGWGLVRLAHEPACVLGLAVTLGAADRLGPERLPAAAPWRQIGDLALPLLPLLAMAGAADNSRRVLAALTLPQTLAVEAG